MSKNMPGHVRAGRLFRLIGWIGLLLLIPCVIIHFLIGWLVFDVPLKDYPNLEMTITGLVILVIMTILWFRVGRGLKEHKEWARTVGCAMGILMLFGFPVGTVLGVYVLWRILKGWEIEPVEPSVRADHPDVVEE